MAELVMPEQLHILAYYCLRVTASGLLVWQNLQDQGDAAEQC